MQNLSVRKITVAMIISLMVVLSGCKCQKTSSSSSSGATTFEDIVTSDSKDYDKYQVKLTYMGPQTAAVVSLVFGPVTPDISLFKKYERKGADYSNDQLDFARFKASGSEIEAMINTLNGTSVYKDTTDKPSPVLSLMIMRDTGGQDERVFETLVEYTDATPLLRDHIMSGLDAGNVHGQELCTFWLKNVGG